MDIWWKGERPFIDIFYYAEYFDLSNKLEREIMSQRTTKQYRVALRRNIQQYFSQNEIKSLCFDLGIDYDDLSGDDRTQKVIELIQYMERNERLAELVEYLTTVRPTVNWGKEDLLKGQDNAQYVEMVSANKPSLDPRIHDRKLQAKKIDMLGVTLYNFLGEIAYDSSRAMVKRVMYENVRLRIIFVHPKADYLKQRSIEDKNGPMELLLERQKTSVTSCLHFYKQLKTYYETIEKFQDTQRGWVEIKFTNFCPYLTIERYDFDIYWGFYSADTAGFRNPTFLATFEENFHLYNKLKKHFSALLEKGFDDDPKDLYLVRMGVGEPWLNRNLAEEILGKEEVSKIIDA
jgi:hypothetical protein